MKTRLEILRNEHNLSQTDIAKLLSVSVSIYSRWEKNADTIPTRRIYEIAEYYEVNIDYLLNLSNKKRKIKTNRPLDKFILASNARTFRKEQKLTLRSLASILNTTSSTWSAYETGKTIVLSSFLYEIAKTYGYSVDWFLGRSNEKYCKQLSTKDKR